MVIKCLIERAPASPAQRVPPVGNNFSGTWGWRGVGKSNVGPIVVVGDFYCVTGHLLKIVNSNEVDRVAFLNTSFVGIYNFWVTLQQK